MSEDFDYYIREVYKIPSLSSEEQNTLLDNIRQGDEEAKKILVESYLKLVVDIAKEYKYFKYEAKALDMITTGNDALIEAADSYSKECDKSFHKYAEEKVRFAIADYCKDIHYYWNKQDLPAKLLEEILKKEQ